MRKIQILKNIKNIFILHGSIILQESNELLLPNEEYKIDDDDYIGISESCLIKTNSTKEYVYIYENSHFTLLGKGWTSVHINSIENYALLKFNYEEPYSTTIKIVTSTNSTIIEEIGWNGIVLLDNEQIILFDMLHKKNIHSVSLNNTPIWQFKLPEEFKIWNDIKRVEDTLFFEARKGVIRNNNVYGLDIHTGKIKWEFHFSLEENTGFVATNVDKKTNLSYGYGGIYYQVFDPVNGRMLLSKDMTKYYEQNVQPVSWNNAIADNRLWFVSGQGENAKFGALNIETSEMEFIQDYPLANNGQFSKPVFYDGKLYLLDHYNKELHIFEK